MTFSALWTNPARIRDRLVGWVAGLPARVQTKLLVAFLTIAGLLIVLGAVGLQVLNGVNQRTEELIKLQRKIAAYQQVQHDTTNQLYSISTALLLQDDKMLEATLRQLNQFGYDLDRMEFIAQDEVDLLVEVRKDYDRFSKTVTRVVDTIRGGRTAEAREMQRTEIIPLADRLERMTNQLVNIAEADMVAAIDATSRTYRTSRIIVIAFALGSLLLALALGYVISWSLISPVREIEARLRRIAAGEFGPKVAVSNRDEFGILAANVNQTSEQLGRLYNEIESRRLDLSEALQQQTATAEVLKVISRSAFDLDAVLRTLVKSASELCHAPNGYIFLRQGDLYTPALQIGWTPEFHEFMLKHPIRAGRGSIAARVALTAMVHHIPDVLEDAEYTLTEGQRIGGYRSLLGVPLLRDGQVTGVFVLARPVVQPFSQREIDLVQTFSDQAVIAIENVRLFEEVQTRNRELSEALEQQTATGAILRAIASSPTDIQPVLDAVAESAAKLCDAYDGAILLRDGNSLSWKAHYGPIPIDFVSWPINREWVTGRAVMDARPIHVHDLSTASEFPDGQQMALRLGHRTMLAVPLLREGVAIGALVIRRSLVRPFSAKQIELLTIFADQAVIAIENVRLFEEVHARTRELQESLEYQTATGEILNVISRSPTNLQPVMDVVAENAARVCGATDALIFRVEGDVQHLVASHGPLPTPAIFRERGVPIVRSTVIGRAVLDRRSIHVADLAAELETEFPDAKPYQPAVGYRTALATPLLREGVPLGTIFIRRMEVKPFSGKQIALLETFADQAVIAIENVRLFEEVQARNRDVTEALAQQTATAEVLKTISSSAFDLDAVLRTLVKSASELCHAPNGYIFLRQGDLYTPALQIGWTPEFHEFMLKHPIRAGRGSIAARVALTAMVHHIPDVLEDAEYTLTEGQRIGGYRSLLGVPLLRDGQVTGVFVLARPLVQPFSQREIDLVQTFSDQAVIAIENVRLFEEVQAKTRDLGEALQQQTATADVLKAISRSTFDLQAVLDTLAASAVRVCEADKCVIFQRDGDLYRWSANFGNPPELEAFARAHPFTAGRASVTGRVAMEATTIHVVDVLADPEYTAGQYQKLGGYRTILGVPLMRKGMPIGVFALTRQEVKGFTQRQIELVETFADQAVIAIENVRLFEEVQARTGELARSVGELKALGEVSQAVNSTLDLKTVLDTIVAKAVHLSGTDAGAIYVFSKATEKFRLRATFGMSEELIAAISGQAIGLKDAGIGEAARNRAPLQVPDLSETILSPVQKIVLDAGYRAVLVVPLLRPNKILGALVVRRRLPGRFEDSTVHLMETFAAQSVLAIQNARLFSEIEEKSRQLEVASRHKSQFLANMSHELRTPLNSVLGFSEMLADGLYGELPEKAVATLARIQANGKHLLGLINDVLDLSKIEAGQLQLVLDSYSPGQIVRTVAAATEPLARAKGLELRTQIDDGMPMGRSDERRLTQVLLNLAGNAVKFTDAGSVEIIASIKGEFFEFAVRDTGPGIAPEFQARIFEEFQQVDDSSTRKKGGTGLGLAISKRIVEMHGGRIGLTSAAGAGSTFRVTIPVRAVARTEAA